VTRETNDGILAPSLARVGAVREHHAVDPVTAFSSSRDIDDG
jgi:hypothetical protein